MKIFDRLDKGVNNASLSTVFFWYVVAFVVFAGVIGLGALWLDSLLERGIIELPMPGWN